MAGNCLSAILIIAIVTVAVLSFRFGIDRQQQGKIVPSGYAQFLSAVCAILSHEKYGSGRYVCASSVDLQMQSVGLGYSDEVLQRIGKTLPEWLADTAFLNGSLEKAFASPRFQ